MASKVQTLILCAVAFSMSAADDCPIHDFGWMQSDPVGSSNEADYEECQTACQRNSDCEVWRFDIRDGTCTWMKGKVWSRSGVSYYTSGPKFCPTTAAPNTTTAAPNTTTRSTVFAGVESMVDPVAAGDLVIDEAHRLFEVREGAAAHRVHLNAWQAAGAACGAILFSLAMVASMVRGNILGEGGQQPLISEVEEELESAE